MAVKIITVEKRAVLATLVAAGAGAAIHHVVLTELRQVMAALAALAAVVVVALRWKTILGSEQAVVALRLAGKVVAAPAWAGPFLTTVVLLP